MNQLKWISNIDKVEYLKFVGQEGFKVKRKIKKIFQIAISQMMTVILVVSQITRFNLDLNQEKFIELVQIKYVAIYTCNKKKIINK